MLLRMVTPLGPPQSEVIRGIVVEVSPYKAPPSSCGPGGGSAMLLRMITPPGPGNCPAARPQSEVIRAILLEVSPCVLYPGWQQCNEDAVKCPAWGAWNQSTWKGVRRKRSTEEKECGGKKAETVGAGYGGGGTGEGRSLDPGSWALRRRGWRIKLRVNIADSTAEEDRCL